MTDEQGNWIGGTDVEGVPDYIYCGRCWEYELSDPEMCQCKGTGMVCCKCGEWHEPGTECP